MMASLFGHIVRRATGSGLQSIVHSEMCVLFLARVTTATLHGGESLDRLSAARCFYTMLHRVSA